MKCFVLVVAMLLLCACSALTPEEDAQETADAAALAARSAARRATTVAMNVRGTQSANAEATSVASSTTATAGAHIAATAQAQVTQTAAAFEAATQATAEARHAQATATAEGLAQSATSTARARALGATATAQTQNAHATGTAIALVQEAERQRTGSMLSWLPLIVAGIVAAVLLLRQVGVWVFALAREIRRRRTVVVIEEARAGHATSRTDQPSTPDGEGDPLIEVEDLDTGGFEEKCDPEDR